MELLEIILQGKLFYLLFQILRLILIDINDINTLKFFDELSSGHIINFLIPYLSSLLGGILLMVQTNNLWCFRINW